MHGSNGRQKPNDVTGRSGLRRISLSDKCSIPSFGMTRQTCIHHADRPAPWQRLGLSVSASSGVVREAASKSRTTWGLGAHTTLLSTTGIIAIELDCP